MSCYSITVKHKNTGEKHRVFAIDDYFGRRIYGYKFLSGVHCNLVVTADELDKNYERVDE